MEPYNHFTYGELIARRLKAISHTDDRPRFFTAFGIEDLYNFDDKLSSVTGTILIAVDGHESDSTDNGFDSLYDRRSYSYIVARNTINDRPETINQAADQCRLLAKQIRNRLFNEQCLKSVIDRNTQITGIGPIGDNFYGVILSFALNENEDFYIDPTYWKE